MNLNWKAIFLLTILVMSAGICSAQRVSAANTFSGFVDNDGTYFGLANIFSEWTLEQYTVQGKRTLNTPWMTKHKVIDNIGTYGQNRILYRYANYVNVLGIVNHRYVSLSLSIYDYHGGEITVKPVQTDVYPTDFNVYINGNFYQSVHADGGSDHEISMNLEY